MPKRPFAERSAANERSTPQRRQAERINAVIPGEGPKETQRRVWPQPSQTAVSIQRRRSLSRGSGMVA
ncbi:hypothetical protein GN956_G9724 [Arapaima gigas]